MASVWCVAGSACVEVGQEGILPLAWGPAQAGDFGDGPRWQALDKTGGQALALDGCGLVEDLAHLLGAVVGDFDTDMRLICHEGLTEAFLLTWGESAARGAQKKPDLIEGITLVSAVTQCFLLDAAAYLIESVRGELDDVKGVQHAGCVLELVINGVLISLEGIQRRDLDTGAKLFAALGQPVLVHGARPFLGSGPTGGPWGDPSRVSGPRYR